MYRRFTIFNTSDNIEIIHTCGIDYPTCEHTHSKWIIGIVVSGRRIIEIEKKMYEVHEGAYYIVPPNSPHRLISGTIENETIVVCLPGNGKDSTDSSLNTRYNFYSREHGIRKFKKEYGLPPGRMARQFKIKTATQLLLNGFPASYAANEAGFHDQSHFCRCFKALWGIPPQTYIKAKLAVNSGLNDQVDRTLSTAT